MSVFADTSSIYAAMVRTEDRHRESLAILEGLLSDGRVVQTTNYVVLETIALLQHRIGMEPARDFEEQILPLMSVSWVDKELHLADPPARPRPRSEKGRANSGSGRDLA